MQMGLGLGLGMTKNGRALPAFEPNATVALDFVNNRYRVGLGTGSTSSFASLPGLTVTRNSGGYAENSDGSLKWFNGPRTNLFIRSQEFDNATWTKPTGT